MTFQIWIIIICLINCTKSSQRNVSNTFKSNQKDLFGEEEESAQEDDLAQPTREQFNQGYTLRMSRNANCSDQDLEITTQMLNKIWGYILIELRKELNFPIRIQRINDTSNGSDIILEFYQTFDAEQGYTQVNYCGQLDKKQWQTTDTLLQENFLFLAPSLLVGLIKKIVLELIFTLLIIFLPWVLLNANLLALINKDSSVRGYVNKLVDSLEILMGIKKTHAWTLIYKFLFFLATILLCSVIMTDFLFIVASGISRQSFNSINDLIMSQLSVCLVQTDPMIDKIVQPYRDLNYIFSPDVEGCIDYIQQDDSHIFFVSEFVFSGFLHTHNSYNNLFKYSVKENTFKSYNIMINRSQPIWMRRALDRAITSMQQAKVDLEVRREFLVPIIYQRKKVNSIISSNTTFLSCCIMITLMFALMIQISKLREQYYYYKNDIPFDFQPKENPHLTSMSNEDTKLLKNRQVPQRNTLCSSVGRISYVDSAGSNIFERISQNDNQLIDENVSVHTVRRHNLNDNQIR